MAVVYIVSSNGDLKVKDNVLFYQDYSGNETKILPTKVDQIVVIGLLQISGKALNLIMHNKISMIFLQKNGKYNGKLVYEDNKNTLIRHKQHVLAMDADFSLSVARDIVKGKLHNQYLYLQRISRKLEKDRAIDNTILEFKRVRKLLEAANSIDEVRGYEGLGAQLYFSQLGKNINVNWVRFTSRNKNPPRDPVNAVLSFLYTVLANRIDSFISLQGMDSSIGSLHALTYGRKSLVFDLIEEFRVPIVDTLTCMLFNNGVLNTEDFREENIINKTDSESLIEQNDVKDNDKMVLLNEGGLKKVLVQFEKKLQVEHMYQIQDKLLSYDKIIYEQVGLYRQVIGGFIDHYIPVVIT